MLILLPVLFRGLTPFGHVTSIERVIDVLGGELGRKITVSHALAKHEILLLRGSANAELTLNALAKTVHATLVKDDKGDIELVRSDSETRELRRICAAERKNWLERSLKNAQVFRKGFQSISPDVAIASGIQEQIDSWKDIEAGKRFVMPGNGVYDLMPARVFLEGLISKIGTSELSLIPSGESRIYEDSPSSSAKPLPRHEDLSSEYNSKIDKLASLGVRDLVRKIDPSSVASVLFVPPENGREVKRWRLQCWANSGSIIVDLDGYDANGRLLDRSYLRGGTVDVPRVSQSYLQEQKLAPNSVWQKLSDEAVKALQPVLPNTAPPLWFTDPQEKDPLDFYVREALEGLETKDQGDCIIYDVPDALWLYAQGCVDSGKLNLDAFRQATDEWLPLERIHEKGFTMWRPKDIENAEAQQADRSVLKRFAKSKAISGFERLRAISRLYHDSSHATGVFPGLWERTSRVLNPEIAPRGAISSDTLSFLGSIPDAIWPRFVKGEALSANSSGVGGDLERWLTTQRGISIEKDSRTPDVFSHTDELFPAGDFGQAVISIKLNDTRVLRAWQAKAPEVPYWSPASEALDILRIPEIYFQARKGQLITLITREKFEERLDKYRFREGTQSSVQIKIGLPRGCAIRQEGLATTRGDAKDFKYSDIPAAIRDSNWEAALKSGMKRAQEALKSQLGGRSGG